MGKGDMRTERGKIRRGTHGKRHPKLTKRVEIKVDSTKKLKPTKAKRGRTGV